MVNERLIRDVVNYIETHPQEWDQNLWYAKGSCGTQYCFAGCALFLSGRINEHGELKEWDQFRKFETQARDILGLTDDQAMDLFYDMETDISLLRAYVTDVTGVEFDA